jgi:hypothetical protein
MILYKEFNLISTGIAIWSAVGSDDLLVYQNFTFQSKAKLYFKAMTVQIKGKGCRKCLKQVRRDLVQASSLACPQKIHLTPAPLAEEHGTHFCL